MSAEHNRAHLDGYLDYLKFQRRLAELSVASYGRDLVELQQFCAALPVPAALPSVTLVQIRQFTIALHSRGLNPRSIARKLSAWRGFFTWLAQQLPMAQNPVDGVKPPKRKQALPKALSADDAVQLVSVGMDPAQSTHSCNQAMFELLYSSGLRVSELTSLDVRHVQETGHTSAGWIDFDDHTVKVTGKGSKVRSVPVGQPALTAILSWLTLRGSLVKNDPHALFLSERGTRISARVLQLRLKAHAQKIGIPSDVHPHVLRHSFASHVLQSSGDLRAVQEMLGHAAITSTQVYTALDFMHLAKVYDAAHPRAKKRNE